MIYVDQTGCTGCGMCVEACPQQAIKLDNGVALIEQSLCTECEACLTVCPNGVILVIGDIARDQITRNPMPISGQAKEVAVGSRRFAGVLPMVGAALSFIGREVVPRAAELLTDRESRRVRPWRKASSTIRRHGRAGWGRQCGQGRRRRGR